MEEENAKVLFNLNLPAANSERKTPVHMSVCTHEDRNSVSCSSGIIPHDPCQIVSGNHGLLSSG
jgi:hypothetical protein